MSTTAALRMPSSRFSSCCFVIFASGIWSSETARAGAFRSFVAARRSAAATAGPLRRARPTFSGDAAHALGLVELARGVSRSRTELRRRDLQPSIRCRSSSICTCSGWRTISSRALRRSPSSSACPSACMAIMQSARIRRGPRPGWTRASYRLGAEIGAPPDQLALKGQGWGIPPPDPVQMEMQRLQGFMHLVRNNMRCYGALRLDHVMSLFRLWWVAAGYSPTEGAYVHYPLQQLLTVLALESARSRCLVVGRGFGRRAGRDAPRHGPNSGSTTTRCCCSKRMRPIPAARRIRAARSRHGHDS